ncbi:MAG TPA: PEP/pyruvate-binding domain-containing protein [Tepidiformaceae bacterium]|nr:PEP/pyruvate-binding domain-containing protein [Tepidiformaceae bacterium]
MAHLPWLKDLPPDNLNRYGEKGASLGQLARASFEVPPGFVIPFEAARELAAPMEKWPADLARGLLAQFRALTPNYEPVAVRSSPLAGESEAHEARHETVLGVVGSEAFYTALASVLAWPGRQGVVVQHMIDVDSSGIVTAGDVETGNPRHIVLRAVNGSGADVERIATEGQRYVVHRASLEVLERPSAPAILNDAKVRWATRAAIRASDLFRAPQELEFAFGFDRKLWLFQARSITLTVPASPSPAT